MSYHAQGITAEEFLETVERAHGIKPDDEARANGDGLRAALDFANKERDRETKVALSAWWGGVAVTALGLYVAYRLLQGPRR